MDAKNNLLIYVVEDNKIYNRFISEYLKKQGYFNVKSFLSGEECIKKFREESLRILLFRIIFWLIVPGLKL